MRSSKNTHVDRGWVDNVHLISYGKSLEANREVLKKASEICLHMIRTLSTGKYELLHLTRSLKKFNTRATVELGKVAGRHLAHFIRNRSQDDTCEKARAERMPETVLGLTR